MILSFARHRPMHCFLVGAVAAATHSVLFWGRGLQLTPPHPFGLAFLMWPHLI